MSGANASWPFFTARTLESQTVLISLADAGLWYGPEVGGYYQPTLVRLPDGRWFTGRETREGFEAPPGWPRFEQIAVADVPMWCEANWVPFPAELMADLSAPAARPPAAGSVRPAKPPKGTKPPAAGMSPDELPGTAWKLLRAIRDLRAIDSEHAVSRDKITSKARTGNHDSDHNKDAFGQLSEIGLIKAKRKVGTWISDAGIQALDKRSKSG